MKTATLNAKINDYNTNHSSKKKTVKQIVFERLAEMGYTVKTWDDVKKLSAEVDYTPINYVTRRPYTGVNLLLLDDGEYMTWKQVQNMGAKVKKGAASYLVCYCQPGGIKETTDEDGNEIAKITAPILKYYRVFNTRDIDGLPRKEKPSRYFETADKLEEMSDFELAVNTLPF